VQVKVLLVSGITRGTTEVEVNAVFSEFGPVEAIRITPDGTRAYVEYFTADQAQQALSICDGQKNILRIGDSLVTVQMANLGPTANAQGGPMAHAALQAAQWAVASEHVSALQNTEQQRQQAVVQEPKPLPEWPTPFDEGGMSYRMDPKSGLYFEDKSGYYFDYAKKLYYSTVKEKYYKYENKTFVDCEAPVTQTKEKPKSDPKKDKAKKGLLSFSISGSLTSQLSGDKMEIPAANSNHENFSKPVTAAKSAKALAASSRKSKEITKNIQQWNSNQKKLSDKPICLLCRRKFPSLEKLKKHEQKSEMHKENLRKQKLGISKPISVAEPKTVQQATKAAEAAGYIDRAGERRKTFGQDTKPLGRSMIQRDINRMETPLYVAEEDNKGVNLLKAMGWKEGEGLGRNNDGIAAPIGLDGKVQNAQ